jgi:hypothetical protein
MPAAEAMVSMLASVVSSSSCARRIRCVSSHCSGVVPVVERKWRARWARADVRLASEVLYGERLVEPPHHPGEQVDQRMAVPGGYRSGDELGLATGPVGRHDQAAGDHVGDCGAARGARRRAGRRRPRRPGPRSIRGFLKPPHNPLRRHRRRSPRSDAGARNDVARV